MTTTMINKWTQVLEKSAEKLEHKYSRLSRGKWTQLLLVESTIIFQYYSPKSNHNFDHFRSSQIQSRITIIISA